MMETRPPINQGKRALFSCLLLLICWFIWDASLYAVLNYIGSTRNLFYAPDLPSEQALNDYYEKYFHPRWGWDIDREKKGPLGNRIGRSYEEQVLYDLKIFGDSFSYGDEVLDNQTFEYYVEEKTGWTFLNYGVGGYATDQALLKYQDNRVASRYTLLGILDENIGRCMTVWWNFYEQGFAGTKPRFELADGNIRLVANPASSYQELQKLNSLDFVNKLKQHDYWQGYYESINAPAELRWPATLTLFRHFDFFTRYFGVLVKGRISPSLETSLEAAKYYHLYRNGSDGLLILQHIVDKFVTTAKSRGEIPIVVVFPLRRSVDILRDFGASPYQTLTDHLRGRRYRFLDFGDLFVAEDYPSYYLGGNGHFSPTGNKRVADALVAYFEESSSTGFGSRTAR